MTTARERAEKLFSKTEGRRAADDRRDSVFFAERKAKEEANKEKTARLKAQRLAHQATLPPKAEKPKRGVKKPAP